MSLKNLGYLKMKEFNLRLVFLSLIFLSLSTPSISATGDKYWTLFERDIFGLDFDCKPVNTVQNAKRIIDPRAFWIDKNVKISMLLEDNHRTDYNWLEVCRYRKGKTQEKCIYMQTTRKKAMYQCLAHTKRMCRLNGGYC